MTSIDEATDNTQWYTTWEVMWNKTRLSLSTEMRENENEKISIYRMTYNSSYRMTYDATNRAIQNALSWTIVDNNT